MLECIVTGDHYKPESVFCNNFKTSFITLCPRNLKLHISREDYAHCVLGSSRSVVNQFSEERDNVNVLYCKVLLILPDAI